MHTTEFCHFCEKIRDNRKATETEKLGTNKSKNKETEIRQREKSETENKEIRTKH
jgi:hypothetical protein